MHEDFLKINRFWIAQREQEICTIIRASIFCVDKTCFPRPSHISIYQIYTMVKSILRFESENFTTIHVLIASYSKYILFSSKYWLMYFLMQICRYRNDFYIETFLALNLPIKMLEKLWASKALNRCCDEFRHVDYKIKILSSEF